MPVDGFDTQIAWSGFQTLQSRPAGSEGDAETYSEYAAPSISFAKKGAAVVVKSADVSVSLNGQKSWVVDGKANAELLQHEQGHYDITALAAREFQKALLTLSAADVQALKTKVSNLNASFEGKIGNANKRYDKQTNHSQVKSEQEKWNKALAAEKQKADGSLDNLP